MADICVDPLGLTVGAPESAVVDNPKRATMMVGCGGAVGLGAAEQCARVKAVGEPCGRPSDITPAESVESR